MYNIDINFEELIVKNELLDYDRLKKAFENVLNVIDDERLVDIICELPKVKPIIKFKVLYYLLDVFRNDADLELDFEIMRGFLEKDIDVFMLVNSLNKKDCLSKKRTIRQ